MAHTNETTNYHLSQFIGTDIPNPLTDYNGDMEKIDIAVKAVADSAVSESARITALETQNGDAVLTTTAQTLSGAVNELDSDLGGVDARLVTAEGKIVSDEATLNGAVDNIATLAGKVSGLETKVGSAVLTTTAADCSGAINELDGKIGNYKIDKLNEEINIMGDGVKTYADILGELLSTMADIIANAPSSHIFKLGYVNLASTLSWVSNPPSIGGNTLGGIVSGNNGVSGANQIRFVSTRATSVDKFYNITYLNNDGTVLMENRSSNVPTTSDKCTLTYSEYIEI